MNKVTITGRIANDLEIRKTNSNKSVIDLSVAVSRERKNESGAYPVDFLRVYAWEQRADFLKNYAKKGTLIGVTGRLETSNFVNKNGQTIHQTYIQAESVEILRQPQEKKEEISEESEPAEDNGMFGGNNYGISQDELPFY